MFQEIDIENTVNLHAEVAEEGRWIGSEPPIDLVKIRARFAERFPTGGPNRMFVAVAESAEGAERIIGMVGIEGSLGLLDLGMLVAPDWRGRGVGSALLEAAIAWAREKDAHKITLQVWPHNDAAIRLYEKFGFEKEGYLRRHWRRRSGELWDAIIMGLLLDEQESSA